MANPTGPGPGPGGQGGMRQRDPRPAPLTRAQKWQVTLGLINANVLAAVLIAVTQLLTRGNTDGGFYGISATVLIPILMGFASAYTWREVPLTGKGLAFWALVNTIIGMVMAYFFLHEGTVCLVMACPLLYGTILVSTVIAAHLLRPKPGPIAVSVVPVLVGALLYNCLNPVKEYRSAVTTSVRVDAPPNVVFPHTVAFPPINAPATGLINRVGLPWPVQTTVDAPEVGATRRCIFSGNLVIGERITELTPGKSMTFAITSQPRYPEFTDHGKLLQGQITVTGNSDGTTTLTGTSWYAMRVYPAWYFGPWADGIIHGVHYRVFDHIKALSEAEAAKRRLTATAPQATMPSH